MYLFWKSCKVRQDLYGVLGQFWEIFLNALTLHQESVRVFERNAPSTTEHAYLLKILKI